MRIHELITRIKSFIITPDMDAMFQGIENVRNWERPLISFSAWVGWILFVNCFNLWESCDFQNKKRENILIDKITKLPKDDSIRPCHRALRWIEKSRR